MTNQQQDSSGRIWALLWKARRSVRYHDRRFDFFATLYRLAMFVALMSGPAALLALALDASEAIVGAIFTLAPLAVGSILAAGLAHKTYGHRDLRHDWIELERAIVRAGDDPDSECVRELEAAGLAIDDLEAPVLRALDSLCHNELCRAMGYSEEQHIRIGFWQRVFAQWFDFREHTIRAP